MTKNRELLTLAAKAAGIKLDWLGGIAIVSVDGAEYRWDPKNDDGDSMRLANILKIDIIHHPTMILCRGWEPGQDVHVSFTDGDRNKAVREAVLKAAVQIGRAMTPHRCQYCEDKLCGGTGRFTQFGQDRPCDGVPF